MSLAHFIGEVCSFLSGHWYFNSVLIIGQEKLKAAHDDEVSPHGCFSTMSALSHISRSFRQEWHINETHSSPGGGINNWRRSVKKAATGEFGRFDLTESGELETRNNNGKVIVSADYAVIFRRQREWAKMFLKCWICVRKTQFCSA